MVSLVGNRFYKGMVYSLSDPKHPNFRYLIIDTVYEGKDPDGDYYTDSVTDIEMYYSHRDKYDIFYGVYGSYWIDIPKSSIKITETLDLKEAITIAEEIMGTKVISLI